MIKKALEIAGLVVLTGTIAHFGSKAQLAVETSENTPDPLANVKSKVNSFVTSRTPDYKQFSEQKTKTTPTQEYSRCISFGESLVYTDSISINLKVPVKNQCNKPLGVSLNVVVKDVNGNPINYESRYLHDIQPRSKEFMEITYYENYARIDSFEWEVTEVSPPVQW